MLNTFDRDGQLRLRPNPSQIFRGKRVGEDRAVVRESGGLVLVGWFSKVLCETVVRVVVLHAKAAELRKVSACQISGPETERPGVNRHQQSGVPTGLGTIDETGSQLPVRG